MNQRKAIRDRVKLILSGETAAGANVFINKITGWKVGRNLPGISIYTPTENSELFQEAPRIIKRTLSLSIEIVDKLENAVVDLLDTIAQQVEKALYLQDYLGIGDDPENPVPFDNIQHQYPLLISSTTTIRGEQENELAGEVLTYQIVYHTDEPSDSDIAYSAFQGADIKYDQPPPDFDGDDVDAEDEVNLPQP